MLVKVMLDNSLEDFYSQLSNIMYHMVKYDGMIDHVNTDNKYDSWWFSFNEYTLADGFAQTCSSQMSLIKVEMTKTYPIGTGSLSKIST